jgi:hypothetical protein
LSIDSTQLHLIDFSQDNEIKTLIFALADVDDEVLSKYFLSDPQLRVEILEVNLVNA